MQAIKSQKLARNVFIFICILNTYLLTIYELYIAII